ncbi:unnamed protein product, partial [Closterium sp. Naga37s-1]
MSCPRQDLLRADSLQYSVFPVYGYDDITAHANKAAAGNQAYTAVFLNCGATEDLCGLLGVGPSVSLFVLDCHRPVHLTNAALHNTKPHSSLGVGPSVLLFVLDCHRPVHLTNAALHNTKVPWGMRPIPPPPSYPAGASPVAREQAREPLLIPFSPTPSLPPPTPNFPTLFPNILPIAPPPPSPTSLSLPPLPFLSPRCCQVVLAQSPESEPEDPFSLSSTPIFLPPPFHIPPHSLPPPFAPPPRHPQVVLAQSPESEPEDPFLSPSLPPHLSPPPPSSQPSGCVVFEMAHGMRRDTSEHLWLACVSITDQFVHSRLAPEHYTAGCLDLEEKVTTAAAMEAPRTAVMEDGVSVKLPDMGRIQFQHELRLMCLPRWNLFDSLLYSSYPATKLKTWTEPGLRRLRLLLGQLGIPHAQAKQRYPFMPAATRSRLKDDVQRFGPSHGLSDMCYRAFHRYNGYKFHVSASDVVYGITALLESHSPAPTGLAPGDNGAAHAHTNDSFWTALSALHLRGWKQLEEGMDLAIRMQAALVRQGSLAIAKKGAIRSTCGRHRFRYMLLDDHSDARLIAHPLALTRLLLFLMDALKEQGERPRPMVVAASLPSSPSALIVGLSHKPRLGQLMG